MKNVTQSKALLLKNKSIQTHKKTWMLFMFAFFTYFWLALYFVLFYSLECPKFPTPLSGNGTFSSPNYPKFNYPSARDCYWLITAAAGKRVKVTIKDFAMGATCDNCNGPYCSRVEFYDGPSNASSYLGRFCTGSQRTAKVSSGNQMFVKFYSSFDPDRGFQAEYSETTEDPSPTEVMPTVPSTTGKPSTTPQAPTTGMSFFFLCCTCSCMTVHISSWICVSTLCSQTHLFSDNFMKRKQRKLLTVKEAWKCGHFWVALNLILKARLREKLFIGN